MANKQAIKIGDRVKRTQASHGGMNVGDIGTVEGISKMGTLKLKEFKVHGYGGSSDQVYHDPDNLEVVKPESKTTKTAKETKAVVFEKGDRVEAHGLKGEVFETHPGLPYSVGVKFENGELEVYTADGKDQEWHKTPCLKLIEKAKTQSSAKEESKVDSAPMSKSFDAVMTPFGLDAGGFDISPFIGKKVAVQVTVRQ